MASTSLLIVDYIQRCTSIKDRYSLRSHINHIWLEKYCRLQRWKTECGQHISSVWIQTFISITHTSKENLLELKLIIMYCLAKSWVMLWNFQHLTDFPFLSCYAHVRDSLMSASPPACHTRYAVCTPQTTLQSSTQLLDINTAEDILFHINWPVCRHIKHL